MKKLLFHLCSLAIILSFAAIGCNKNDTLVNSTSENTTFDPGILDVPLDNSVVFVQEYVKVSPLESAPYYEYRPALGTLNEMTTFDLLITPVTTTITTPAASRYEGDNLVETQHFRVSYSSRWRDFLCNYWMRYEVKLGGSYAFQDQIDFFGECNDPFQTCDPQKSEFCETTGTLSDEENISLSPSTAYTLKMYMDGLLD